jgi:hypothetical protein
VLDHLWAGLPSLLSDGDQSAAMAREHGVGLVAPPQDVLAVAEALITLLSDADLRAGMAARARALAPRFAWPNLVRPIIEFLAATPAAAERHRTILTMDKPQPEAPPPVEDVAQVERGRLIHATRNAAIAALEHTWSLERLVAPSGGRMSRLRRLLQERVLWPLLHPLLARQQEQNAAALRALYAVAEQQDAAYHTLQQVIAVAARQSQDSTNFLSLRIDHVLEGMSDLNQRAVRERHLLAQQIRDLAEQLAGLEDADQQILARLLGEPAPPPAAASRTEGQ